MAIPNPNPNIADEVKCDNKTYSSNKIESLISTATELPIPEAGDAGKVLTVNAAEDGYELDTPVTPSDIEDLYIVRTQTVVSGASIASATESNSIDPIAITSVDGYTPIAVINTRAYGYYGSRVLAYAWIANSGLNYSLYNSSTSVNATVTLDVDILYVKS